MNATGLEDGEKMVFVGVRGRPEVGVYDRQVMVGTCCPLVRQWTVGGSAINGKVDWYLHTCMLCASIFTSLLMQLDTKSFFNLFRSYETEVTKCYFTTYVML